MSASETSSPPIARRVTTDIIVSVLVGGVAPFIVFILLRPHFGEVPALLIGGLFPGIWEIVSFVWHRRLDPVSTLNLAALAVILVMVALGGGARFVLLKESLVTGAIGIGFLVSMSLQRPAHFYLGRHFITANVPDRVARYNATWDAVPYMRTVLRTTTVVWGISLLIEVTVRVVLVFRLSTTQVLVAGPMVFYATMLMATTWTVLYARRTRPRIEAMMEQIESERSDGQGPWLR